MSTDNEQRNEARLAVAQLVAHRDRTPFDFEAAVRLAESAYLSGKSAGLQFAQAVMTR